MAYKVTAGGTAGVVPVFEKDDSEDLPSVTGRVWDDYTGDKKFISENAGSKVPALPVSTDEERKLYAQLRRLNIKEKTQKVDVAAMVRGFDQKADGKNIYRKLNSHISAYDDVYTKAALRKAEISKESSEGRSRSDMQSLYADDGVEEEPYVEPEFDAAIEPDEPVSCVQPPQLANMPPRKHVSTLDPSLSLTPALKKRRQRPCATCRADGKSEEESAKCPGTGGGAYCPLKKNASLQNIEGTQVPPPTSQQTAKTRPIIPRTELNLQPHMQQRRSAHFGPYSSHIQHTQNIRPPYVQPWPRMHPRPRHMHPRPQHMHPRPGHMQFAPNTRPNY